VWPLFEAVLKDVCRERHKGQEQGAGLAAKQFGDLDQREDKLIRALLDGKLKQHLFDERLEKVEGELSRIAALQPSPLLGETELEDLVEFTKWVLSNSGTLWAAAEYDKQLRLQSAFFPARVTVSKGRIWSTEFVQPFQAVRCED
jgi:hypothetical protein